MSSRRGLHSPSDYRGSVSLLRPDQSDALQPTLRCRTKAGALEQTANGGQLRDLIYTTQGSLITGCSATAVA